MPRFTQFGFTMLATTLAVLLLVGLFSLAVLDSPSRQPAAASPAPLPEPATNTYTDPVYGFSFDYPDGMVVETLSNPDGYLVLAEDPMTQLAFQVFIRPFDEIGITTDRIKEHLPDLVVEKESQVSISRRNNLQALTFLTQNKSFGHTQEVWFVWPPHPLPHGNYLYQVTTYADRKEWLLELLSTWRFAE